MTEAQATEAMFEFWRDGWEELHPADTPDYIPASYDNEAFDSVDQWVRVSVIETVRQQTTSGPPGTKLEEVRGRIAVQLFVDIDQGELALAALSDDVRAVLSGKAISAAGEEIAVFEVSPSGPPATDGKWYMRTLNAAYFYQARA